MDFAGLPTITIIQPDAKPDAQASQADSDEDEGIGTSIEGAVG